MTLNLMSKMWTWPSSRWTKLCVPTVENLLSKVYHDPKGQWTELGPEFDDSGVPSP